MILVKKLEFFFSVLLVKIDLDIMFGNILRYSELVGLLALNRRKKKLQSFDQNHGCPCEETLLNSYLYYTICFYF